MPVTTKQTEHSLSHRDDCMDAGGRAPKVGALGDAGAVAERARERGYKYR